MNGALLFLSTIVLPYFNQTFRIFYFLPLLTKRGKLVLRIDSVFYILVIIAVLSQINLMYSYYNGIRTESDLSIQHIVSFNVLTPIAYIIAQQFKPNDLRIFIWLFVIDALFVIAQSYYGVSTFYTNIDGFEEFTNINDLVYFNRPFGLGNNASVFAEKLLAFVLIVHYLAKYYSYNMPKIALAIVTFAGILNFGRTAFIAILFFFAFSGSMKFLKSTVNKKVAYLLLIFIMSSFAIIFYFDQISIWFNEVIRQFTRGNESIDLAGRDLIWNDFVGFISNNLFLGNGSVKYFTDYNGQQATAHNSFLMIIASHGIIISTLYAIAILHSLNRKNIIYIASILVFSGAQYSIFWGISFNDIILFFFMGVGNENRNLRFLSSLKNKDDLYAFNLIARK
ncbi:O-antigen ligase family protein [Sphingorhabdus buctiana]|uniref:O-antigen ligase family protein n=1 Tax=Sphingorhabdus buctiana TaxID=1508805 RepID=A0ABW4MAL0_9SPHN